MSSVNTERTPSRVIHQIAGCGELSCDWREEVHDSILSSLDTTHGLKLARLTATGGNFNEGTRYKGMRATAPYKPIKQPWGEEVTFDQVTASLRYTQLRLERHLAEHKHTERCYHPWFGEGRLWEQDRNCRPTRQTKELLAQIDYEIAKCAQGFVRSERHSRTNTGQET